MPWQGAFEFVAELPLLALEKPEESCTACFCHWPFSFQAGDQHEQGAAPAATPLSPPAIQKVLKQHQAAGQHYCTHGCFIGMMSSGKTPAISYLCVRFLCAVGAGLQQGYLWVKVVAHVRCAHLTPRTAFCIRASVIGSVWAQCCLGKDTGNTRKEKLVQKWQNPGFCDAAFCHLNNKPVDHSVCN